MLQLSYNVIIQLPPLTHYFFTGRYIHIQVVYRKLTKSNCCVYFSVTPRLAMNDLLEMLIGLFIDNHVMSVTSMEESAEF